MDPLEENDSKKWNRKMTRPVNERRRNERIVASITRPCCSHFISFLLAFGIGARFERAASKQASKQQGNGVRGNDINRSKMVGKPVKMRSVLLLWGLWIVCLLHMMSSSPGSLVFVAADSSNANNAHIDEAEAEQEPQQVCVPTDPVDCSKHEQTTRELHASLEALHATLKDVRSNADAAQEACRVQLTEIRAGHQTQLREMEAKLAEAVASRQDDTQNAEREGAMAQLHAALAALQAQYDVSVKDRDDLQTQLEKTAQQLHDLLKDHESQVRETNELRASVRAMEEQSAQAHDALAKRKRELDNELQHSQSRLDKSQQDLFETRQELHAVWEQYVTIRDAWWNLPTRYHAFETWCRRQWDKVDDHITRIRIAAQPHLDQAERVVGSCISTLSRKIAAFVTVCERVTFDWFLPKWRMHVQPHVNQMGQFLAAQGQKLLVVAKEQGHSAWEWAVGLWSNFSQATAPQREQVAELIQPTLDMIKAQFVPTWTALHGAWRASRTAVEESTWLESAALTLQQAETRIVAWIAAASGVAHDYLVLQNAPPALTEPLQLFHRQATLHVASGARNVALAAGATALALLLACLWLVLLRFRRRPNKVQRHQPKSPYRSPQKIDSKEPLTRPKPSSPDLVTEASSSSAAAAAPGASSAHTSSTPRR
jgi:hypothetical protein